MARYYFPEMIGGMLGQFESDIIEQLSGADSVEIMLFIFTRNVQVSFLAIFSGIFYGIIPAGIMVFNGFFVGAVIYEPIQEYGGLAVIAALAPHGVLELPMVIISAAIGFRLGIIILKITSKLLQLFSRGFYENVDMEFNLELKKSFKIIVYEIIRAAGFFILVIIPLLFAAAAVETFITTAIFQAVIT